MGNRYVLAARRRGVVIDLANGPDLGLILSECGLKNRSVLPRFLHAKKPSILPMGDVPRAAAPWVILDERQDRSNDTLFAVGMADAALAPAPKTQPGPVPRPMIS